MNLASSLMTGLNTLMRLCVEENDMYSIISTVLYGISLSAGNTGVIESAARFFQTCRRAGWTDWLLDNEPRNTKLETLVDMLLAFPMPLKRSRFCGNGRAARVSFVILQVFFVLGLLLIYIGRLLVKTSRVKKAVRQTTRIKRRKIRVSFLGLF